MDEDKKIIIIDSEEKLKYLISCIRNKEIVCAKFRFKPYELRNKLLKELEIDVNEFEKKYYIFNSSAKIHISESEKNYILISTVGLVAFNPTFENDIQKIVFACDSQYEVMMILLEKINILKEYDDIYDVDSYHYYYLSTLTTGLFHNIIFYLEVFAKAYISLNNKKYKFTHNLKELLQEVKLTMFTCNQNNSLFHEQIFLEFQNIVNRYYSMDNDLKEQFIKYNDSIQPKILIDYMDLVKNFIEISNDFIIQFYYDRENCFWLEQGLIDKLISRAKNDEEKKKILNCYKYLVEMD